MYEKMSSVHGSRYTPAWDVVFEIFRKGFFDQYPKIKKIFFSPPPLQKKKRKWKKLNAT